MKSIFITALLFTAMVNAQLVNIPDSNFKARLLAADVNNATALDSNGDPIKIDSNNDAQIQETEALAVYKLNLWDGNIANLTGISNFTNLTVLDCHNNALTSLDVTALVNLKQLVCNQNHLTSLNTTGLNQLFQLSCGENELASLTVNNLPALMLLNCEKNNLSGINLSGMNNLIQLVCSYNDITTLDVANLMHLASLQCDHNQLTSLDVTGLSNLLQLNCFYNQISNLTIGNLSGLMGLSCGENSMTALNINGLTGLNYLECSYMPDNFTINGANLTSLSTFEYVSQAPTVNFNGFPNLNFLSLKFSTPAVTINLSGFSSNTDVYIVKEVLMPGPLTLNGIGPTSLKSFSCPYLRPTSLTINNINDLVALNCSNNNMTSLSLNGLNGLKSLDCGLNRLTTLNLSNVPNLEYLDCNRNMLTSLDLSMLTHLKHLDVSNYNTSVFYPGNQLTSLNLTGLTDLEYLDCSNYLMGGMLGGIGNQISSLDVNNLTNLKVLKFNVNKLTSLTVNNLTNLEVLDCSQNLLTNLDLTGLTNLTNLNYSYNEIANLNMAGLQNITELDCSHNSITNLSLSSMPNLSKLICARNNISVLDLTGLTQITSLNCSDNQISTLDLSGMPNLNTLNFMSNNLSTVDLTGLSLLSSLNCGYNNLSTLNLAGIQFLADLDCSGNELTTLDTLGLFGLGTLRCSQNHLTYLDVSGIPGLYELDCVGNNLTFLNLGVSSGLHSLNCFGNNITNLDFTGCPWLEYLDCGNNQLTSLDVSGLTHLGFFWCSNNAFLTELNMKNGHLDTNNFDVSNNPSLAYICADQSEVQNVQYHLNTLGMTTTVCNSYCSFTPGGPHNTVVGTTIFDGNNNGCNINDPLHPNIRVDFSSNTETGSAFTNTNGICTFYADAGNYTIFPNIENASAFNISPASASVSFPDNNNNIMNQSFCLSPNGFHPDLEVVMYPDGPARPGFDAFYEIVFKNKGNQMLSGTINLTFDDSKLDYVASSAILASQATNNLSWDYSGLLPFESRKIRVALNVNSPSETPAVNNGDILDFTIAITPVAGDESTPDNSFDFSQFVVNSFDPNDITCLEGETLSPSEIGNYLHYVVNFENTGTYQAENVVVRDVIDTTQYDLSSLQVLSTSHNAYTRITGNVVEFIFEGINLSAASGNPPVGGHGDVLFKIKTKNDLQPNDMVMQRAGIYFDYNLPIETQDAQTIFAQLNNPILEFDNSVKIYPNPTKSIINIVSDFDISTIELYDVQGRILETIMENSSATKLDISNKSNGIYFLKIKTEKGSKVEKVVKE